MGLKKYAVLFLSTAMLVACGSVNITSSVSSETSESSSSVKSESSKSSSSEAKTSSSSSSTKTSSSSTKTSSSSSSVSSEPVVPPEQKDKDYTVFTSAPTVRFTTTNPNCDLSFATKPTRESEKPYEEGSFTTEGCIEKYKLSGISGKMKVRGNYTSNYQKKPFKIKFDSKQNMFGLNGGAKFKEWVLLADVKDSSMLRNATGFYLGRNLFQEDIFVSDATPVHLYINNNYWGMYLLAEQKEVKEKRVQIAAPEAGYAGTDIGYFFELDHYYDLEAQKADGDPTFTVSYKPQYFNQKHSGENHPNIEYGYTISSDITNRETQVPYIKNRVEMYYTMIYDAVMNHKYHEIENEKLVDSELTSSQELFAKYFDIDSFVSTFILSDIVCDPDIGYSSFYLTLDMSEKGNKKLTCNCPWDFDSSLGVRAGTVENSQGAYAAKSSNYWFTIMAKEQWFMDLVKAKWNKAKEENLFNRTLDMIDDYSSTYTSDYAQNFKKWPRTIGTNPEVDFEVRNAVKNFKTEAEAKALLRSWTSARFTALDKLYNPTGGSTTPVDPNPTVDPTVPSTPTTVDYTEFKNGKTPKRYEAEDSVITSENPDNGVVKTKTGEGISGDKYIGNLNPNPGITLDFEVNNESAEKEALLTLGLSARTVAYKTTDLFDFEINGEAWVGDQPTIPAGTNGSDFHYWTTVDAGKFTLKAGKNTIKLTSRATCTNFDYIDIYA